MAVVINIAMAEEGVITIDLIIMIVPIIMIASIMIDLIIMTDLTTITIASATEPSLRERECLCAEREFVRMMTKIDLNAAAYRTAASAVAAAASAIFSVKYI